MNSMGKAEGLLLPVYKCHIRIYFLAPKMGSKHEKKHENFQVQKCHGNPSSWKKQCSSTKDFYIVWLVISTPLKNII